MVREKLREMRKRNLYTQISLAEELRIAQSTYQMIESGYRMPNETVRVTLCDMFGLDSDYFEKTGKRNEQERQ